MLEIVASYYCMQCLGKLINQTWKNGKKPSFEPDFLFFKKLAFLVTRCHGQLSSCIILEKTNDPMLGKLSDG